MSSLTQKVEPRRNQLRLQMIADIRSCAYAQLAEGGLGAVSLSAIAKQLGVSGPALYRYVNSRDHLLADLVTESWEDLADAMEQAGTDAANASPEARFRAQVAAYRSWGLVNSHRYRLLTGNVTAALDPKRIIPASRRSMRIILTTLLEIASENPSAQVLNAVLSQQLKAWAANHPADADMPATVLLRGLIAQTRIHGLLSLEIEDYFAHVGIDADLLYEHEIQNLLL